MSGGSGFIQKSIDQTTKQISQISSDHRYIHEGKAFIVNETFSALAASGVVNIGITTPAYTSKYIHWRPSVISSSANVIRAELFEDTAYTAGDEIIPINKHRSSSTEPTVVLRRGVTAASPDKLAIVSAKAGGGFTNQPAGDSVDIVSDGADVTQSCTIYGTRTGALTVVDSETIALTSSAPVTTTITDWETILGVELSASCAGTITVSESTGSGAITTISTTVLNAGVQTPTSTDGKYQIPTHDADGASTKSVGILGTGSDGAALSFVDALNGTTEENHGTAVFATIEKVFIGDVEAGVDVTINRPNRVIDNGVYGSGGGPQSRSGGSGGSEHEAILEESTSYVLKIENIGSSTATDVDISLFWYEEGA